MTPQNFADAFERVKELVSIFSKNEDRYLSPGYSEAQARLDFIDKFWIALGWDVNHETQTDPYKQEVKVERGVATNEWRKRADYAFLAPNFRDVRFYVEAKKPHAGIDNPDFYFQTIRYGWNSHTPLSVLTDFEELRVLDCRYKPDIRTAIGHARLKCHYTDYADEEKFRTIYYLFSRESVLNGSIESFAKGLPKLSRKRAVRGITRDEHQDIDEAFLKELDEYREELARAFKRKNPELESEALTEVTQRTLDRLVFMRFLEDKLIETEPLIENLHRRGSAWENFVATSRSLDRVYNGIIFKEHSLLDSPGFTADERTFDKISQNLSHANSPYDFNAIPIHILGSIYERFLGKVIVATDKRARVEEKPEVRKAGGVYYTPEYIVRYIIDNTVGKLIEGKTPEEIRQMRFADIACGSGSFLLGVYDTLLRYHTAYYNLNKRAQNEGRKAGCLPTETGALRLSLLQKRTILLNNVYGVDIDPQAVEVAQLSLYLKLLEDETTASAHQQQLALREALLPSLNKNIVCGNSLVSRNLAQGGLFDSLDERKTNPMNFEDAFPETMRRGGFDSIVGNPPYVRIQTLPPDQVRYLSEHYRSAKRSYDLYVNFIEKGFTLLREGGMLGEILPNKFFRTDYGEGLREFLSDQRSVYEVVDFGANQVFSATTYTCLLFLKKVPNQKLRYAKAEASAQGLEALDFSEHLSESLGKATWRFSDDQTSALESKLTRNAKRLLDLPASMNRGSSTGDDDVFVVESTGLPVEVECTRIPVFATDFTRYNFTPNVRWRVVFPYIVSDGSSHPYTESEIRKKFPKTLAYLSDHREQLKKRKQYREWYGYSAARNLGLHEQAQILVPLLAKHGMFALIPEDLRGTLCMMAGGGFSITVTKESSVDPTYVLGLLNSRLLFWKLRRLSSVFRGGWITCTKQYFGDLPIRTINFSDTTDKAHHDGMVQLVTQILTTKHQLAAARTERDKTFYENKCATIDRQIDDLVYELYELTPEEIALVEGTER
jgi:type I restriction-modification system DNA methylase subunit